MDQNLAEGKRLGVVPGGIAEMFEGYPKLTARKDEEIAIVRKGFLKMAVKHGIPVLPIYCFGATKMFRRLELPILERLSVLFRISVCLFYGVWGLPIPYRQRLTYVMGDAIFPPSMGSEDGSVPPLDTEKATADMHQRFCDELMRIFDSHKEAYGWGHKTLKLISR